MSMPNCHKSVTQNYLEVVYLVTALVPSDTACFANSPGRRRRTAVWISREVIVDLPKDKFEHYRQIDMTSNLLL